MKTTIEIPDFLLAALRKAAAREGVTMRDLVEEGVRRALDARRAGAGPFRLRQASFKGQGLQPGLDGTSWERIRDLVYEGRGS